MGLREYHIHQMELHRAQAVTSVSLRVQAAHLKAAEAHKQAAQAYTFVSTTDPHPGAGRPNQDQQ